MTKLERARIVGKELQRCFPNPAVPLDGENEFTFLVAVILSAQCTDKRVNETTPALFKLADTPSKMVALGEEKIAEIIRPCGFFNNGTYECL